MIQVGSYVIMVRDTLVCVQQMVHMTDDRKNECNICGAGQVIYYKDTGGWKIRVWLAGITLQAATKANCWMY